MIKLSHIYNKILKELKVSGHSVDRVNERIISQNLMTAFKYFDENDKPQKEIVGKFTIPPDIMNIITHGVDIVTDPSNNVNQDLMFAAILYNFSRKEIYDNTTFDDDIDLKELEQYVKYYNGKLTIIDQTTKKDEELSDGVTFVSIIKGNVIKTSMFTYGYDKKSVYDKLSRSKSNQYYKIIVLDPPNEIDYYYDTEDRNLDALH